MSDVIDLAAYRRKLDDEAGIPGTLGWRRNMRELDRLIGPLPGGSVAYE